MYCCMLFNPTFADLYKYIRKNVGNTPMLFRAQTSRLRLWFENLMLSLDQRQSNKKIDLHVIACAKQESHSFGEAWFRLLAYPLCGMRTRLSEWRQLDNLNLWRCKRWFGLTVYIRQCVGRRHYNNLHGHHYNSRYRHHKILQNKNQSLRKTEKA